MKEILNVKTDPEVKRKAQQLSKELGVPLSTVVNAYLKEFIRTREVRLSIAPRMRPELERLIGQVEHDTKTGKNISRAFSSGVEMDAYLHRNA